MNLTIDRGTLQAALTRAASVINRKNPLPVLTCVCLSANDAGLTIEGGDTEQRLVMLADATIWRPGKVLADAGKLLGIVRSLTDSAVEITVTKTEIKVQAGRAVLVMRALSEEYLARPVMRGETFHIKGLDLSRLLSLTRESVATGDHQHALRGIHAERVPAGVRFVSTDGHRLSWAESAISGEFPTAAFGKSLIPRAILPILSRFAEEPGDLRVTIGGGAALIDSGRDQLWFLLIEGDFPDYRAVIPKLDKDYARISVGLLASALKRATLIMAGRARPARFAFRDGECQIRVSNGEEDLDETIPCEFVGEPITLGLNPAYLQDVVDLALGSTIVLHLGHALQPVCLRFDGAADAEFVVMPMRLD